MTEYTSQQLTQARREIKQDMRYPPFDEHQAGLVVAAVAAGNTLASVAKWPGYASRRVVTLWRQTNPDFDAELVAAMDDRADELVERGLAVASDTKRRADCRAVESNYCKWLAGKLSVRYANKGAEGAVIHQTAVTVNGDVNITPADAYMRLVNGSG